MDLIIIFNLFCLAIVASKENEHTQKLYDPNAQSTHSNKYPLWSNVNFKKTLSKLLSIFDVQSYEWSRTQNLNIEFSKPHIQTYDWVKTHPQSHSKTPDTIQEITVGQMLKRLLPNDFDKFYVEVDSTLRDNGIDAFKISSPKGANDSRVYIVGSTGVSTSLGVLHYLKYYCNSHISWEANQINITSPPPACHLKMKLNDKFRYYENVCTFSYSFAWWNWTRWESHLDWMALNGINFPLAFVGQEAIWKRVYTKLNFTKQDLDDFFVGPAFLAWGRMGNIQKWGGPLPDSWQEKTLELQHNILSRMRSFGMIPILPAFAGHVPSAIKRLYPHAKVTRLSAWGKFTSDNYTRVHFLDPQDPLFATIGTSFINEMKQEYNGTDHFYNCDPLNEVTPEGNSTSYLRGISKAIYKTILQADPKAIWVLQGWFLFDDFWTLKNAEAFFSGIPKGKVIVLDLDAATRPLYNKFNDFFGQPFIFCMLNNYGGVNGLFGDLQFLQEQLMVARNDTKLRQNSLIGVGITAEGINQNYINYDFMLEMGWRKDNVSLDDWVQEYATRRYGVDLWNFKEAWILLMDSAYTCKTRHCYHGSGSLMQHTPDFHRKIDLWYNESRVALAFQLISQRSDMNLPETYKHDFVDISRQLLVNRGNNIIIQLRKCFRNKSMDGVISNGWWLLNIFDLLDNLLGSSKDFLLGNWVADAQSWATNEEERKLYLRNALYQITLWGPNGEIKDYAVKQWNGLVRNYLKPRYSAFVSNLTRCLRKNIPFDQNIFNKEVFEKIEKPFADQEHVAYRTEPQGSSADFIQIFEDIYKILNTTSIYEC